MSTPYHVTVETPTAPKVRGIGHVLHPDHDAATCPDCLRSALIGIDDELRRLYGAPHNVEDHGLAHAWVVVRAALYPAGSRVGGGR